MSSLITTREHHNLWLHHAVLRLATYLTDVGSGRALDKYPFLSPYIDAIRSKLPPQPKLAQLDQVWQDTLLQQELLLDDDAPLPLVRLRATGLSYQHFLALMLIGLVETDARFGTVFSILHPFPDELHITVGLLGDLVNYNAEATVSGWHIVCDLAKHGLITIRHSERPRTACTLSVPSAVWDACTGDALTLNDSDMSLLLCAELPDFEMLRGLLPEALLERLLRVPPLLQQKMINGVILRGMRGSGRLRAMSALARQLGCDVLYIRHPSTDRLPELCQLAGPLAVLLGAIPVIDLELTTGESHELPQLAGYSGMFGLILGREGGVSIGNVERCVTFHLPAPRYTARHEAWRRVLDVNLNGNSAVVDRISRQYQLTLGGVEQAAHLAMAYAALDGRDHLALHDVQSATRSLNIQTFESLASRIHSENDWHDLIVTDRTRNELDNLILRCRHREAVLDHLGAGFKGATRGVRGLFSGPSGTGKTLASRIIATELGLDLYRIELSSVVSKYIGETERNLSRLFARAEEQDIVLLLDEGDSLLTARTDVRSSNDRYANMETNYLLQRLEHYEGIILITTNANDRIDSAFQRRMDVVIEFRSPDAGSRQQLWYLHLPHEHAVSNEFLWHVALRCDLTGGQIRNAALHATVVALDAEVAVNDELLIAGIKREYAKSGTPSPLN